MTIRDELSNLYFDWMFDLVCKERYAKDISYRKLLIYLHDTEFKYTISKDANRAEDGMDLRRRFALLQDDTDIVYYLDGPCSMLEMMIALAIRCEENIMDDPRMGDRTGQWFWGMINSLGLGSMTDDRFDNSYVDEVIDKFIFREYEPDGKGGLFTIRNYERDLRKVEIWTQLCWYLDNIV